MTIKTILNTVREDEYLGLFKASTSSKVAFHPYSRNGFLQEVTFLDITFDPFAELTPAQLESLLKAFELFKKGEESPIASNMAPPSGASQQAEAKKAGKPSGESVIDRIRKRKLIPVVDQIGGRE